MPDVVDRHSFGRIMLAVTIGNTLEWYDFAVFGGLADVLGDEFFPAGEPAMRLVQSFGTFGAAFLMRPLGGILIGHVGDTYGRKPALVLSMTLMLLPSFAIGCLPTYHQIGLSATVLLALLRLVQGVAVGGELASAYVFCMEHAIGDLKAFWGAMTLNSAVLGTLLGTVSATIARSALSADDLHRFGWRFCFWFGIIGGVSGLVVRKNIQDTGEFEAAVNASMNEANPVRAILIEHKIDVLLIAGIASAWCGGFYMCFVWMPFLYDDLLVDKDKIPGGAVLNTCMIALLVVFFIPAGFLSARCGTGPLLKASLLTLCVIAIPAFLLINTRSLAGAAAAQVVLAWLLACIGSAVPFYMFTSFPVAVRVAGLGIAYNVSQAFVGSTVSVVSSELAMKHPVAPAFWLQGIAAVSFGSLIFHHRRCVARASLSKNQYLPTAVPSDGPELVPTSYETARESASSIHSILASVVGVPYESTLGSSQESETTSHAVTSRGS